MAKFNVTIVRAINKANAILTHWATKAALLTVGFWCLLLHPHAYCDQG